jgi:hypothetical protein
VANYLIRVQLPDRPGALGAVASRIGSVGGDVISIDILEREHGIVVDELGVGLAGDHLIDLLRDEILEVDGVVIESVRPVEGAIPDRHTELLGLATELFKQTSSAGLLDHVVVRVRRSLAATFAAVYDCVGGEVMTCDGDPPTPDQLAEVTTSVLVPDAYGADPERTDPVPTVGIVVVGHATMAAAGMVEAGMVLVVGRADPILRERELQWISIMAELAGQGWRQLV